MRCTQLFGLNWWARTQVCQMIDVEDVITRTYPDGRSETFTKFHNVNIVKEEIYDDASSIGMFDDGPSLRKYTLPNGKIYYEYVQAHPWSSGPCIFLALKDEKGNIVRESLWADEDIDNA